MHKLVSNPRYQVLADELRRQIARGEYKPGDKLPSESNLLNKYGVSRGTVVRAIEQLVSEGVVHRRQGAGSFVARPSLHRRAGKLLSFSESAAIEGLRSTQALVSIGAATDELIREFQCDGPAIYLKRVRYLDGIACAVHTSIVPNHVAGDVSSLNGDDPAALEQPDYSLYEALDASGHTVREAQERVTTRLAGPEECSLLNITDPSPVMVVFRRSYDASERLVEAVEAVYHGEYYTFDFRLVAAPTAVASLNDANVLSLGGRILNPKTKTGSE